MWLVSSSRPGRRRDFQISGGPKWIDSHRYNVEAKAAAGLVRDAGFDPVPVGPLSRAREFDAGTRVYNTNMSGPEVRRALGLPQAGTAR